ncbi:MAG: hypothetical protein LBG80_00175 [Bacteroidales bacterium]|jgi:hypothetical protein|nr:hypothetical protein [Bacteroidales bacterium]
MKMYISGQLSVLELGKLKKSQAEKGISIVASNSENTAKRIELLVNCDVIYFIDGWQYSIHSYIEMSVAQISNIEIRYHNADN